jgi:L-threonylcarbamoyladenylate synthase
MPAQARIVQAPAGIALAAEHIRAGEVVALPTETLYGLAVDALNPAAVEALLAVKGRGPRQPVPCLVADRAMLGLLVKEVPDSAEALIAVHWPGPLTLILPAVAGLAAPLVNPGGGVGVRITSDPTARELVRLVGRPLTATSANRSGEAPAKCAEAAALSGVSMVLDGGAREQIASTVVEVMPGRPIKVLRQGAIAIAGI